MCVSGLPGVIFQSEETSTQSGRTLGGEHTRKEYSKPKNLPMPDTWTQEMCEGQPSFPVSTDWLEMMLTSYYLFIEGAGDPDVQVRRQGEEFYSSENSFRFWNLMYSNRQELDFVEIKSWIMKAKRKKYWKLKFQGIIKYATSVIVCLFQNMKRKKV